MNAGRVSNLRQQVVILSLKIFLFSRSHTHTISNICIYCVYFLYVTGPSFHHCRTWLPADHVLARARQRRQVLILFQPPAQETAILKIIFSFILKNSQKSFVTLFSRASSLLCYMYFRRSAGFPDAFHANLRILLPDFLRNLWMELQPIYTPSNATNTHALPSCVHPIHIFNLISFQGLSSSGPSLPLL